MKILYTNLFSAREILTTLVSATLSARVALDLGRLIKEITSELDSSEVKALTEKLNSILAKKNIQIDKGTTFIQLRDTLMSQDSDDEIDEAVELVDGLLKLYSSEIELKSRKPKISMDQLDVMLSRKNGDAYIISAEMILAIQDLLDLDE